MAKASHLKQKGFVLYKTEVENRFGKIVLNKEENAVGHFFIRTMIEGVKEPVCIKIHLQILDDKYVQFHHFSVEYSSNSLGEKRIRTLKSKLETILMQDEKLFASTYDMGEQFIKTIHYIPYSVDVRHKRKFSILEKVNSADLELLAIDKYKSCHYYDRDEIKNFSYYYHEKKNLVMQTCKKEYYEKLWNEHNLCALLDTISPHYAVDENGQFYHYHFVDDPAHIRLLRLNYQSLTERHLIQSYGEDEPLYTYYEAIEEGIENHGWKESFPKSISLPHAIGDLTLYSERILGKPLDDWKKGMWVQNKKGKVGQLTEDKIGTKLSILWEFEYISRGDFYDYRSVMQIPDPRTYDKKDLLVGFFINDVYGFGLIAEELPHYFKIIPLKGTTEDFSKQIQHSFYTHGMRRKLAETVPLLHDGLSDFVLVEKKDVFFLDENNKVFILSFYNGNHRTEDTAIFENLLTMIKINTLSRMFFLSRLHEIADFLGLNIVLKQFTNLYIKKESEKHFLESLHEWLLKSEERKQKLCS